MFCNYFWVTKCYSFPFNSAKLLIQLIYCLNVLTEIQRILKTIFLKTIVQLQPQRLKMLGV